MRIPCTWLWQWIYLARKAIGTRGGIGTRDAAGKFQNRHDRDGDFTVTGFEHHSFRKLVGVLPWPSVATAAVESSISAMH
jgi:hypothetical protein